MSEFKMAAIDPVKTQSWARLSKLYQNYHPDLRAAFAADSRRAEKFSFQVADLYVDLSKNLIDDAILKSLLELAEELKLRKRIQSMYRGEKINVTENRAVLHTALRLPKTEKLMVSGQDCVADVHEVLAKMADFCNRLRSGAWQGITGKKIETIVNIGIGGSDLGPVMVYEALQPYVSEVECRFISNIDPTDCAEKLKDLNPETTLFIVASKTFTTIETITNAKMARAWLWEKLAAAGVMAEDEESRKATVAKHFVAVSTALGKVADFGIDPANAFGFWDWVGGRYSVDSAIGLAIMAAIGPQHFYDFLAGFHAVDEHFLNTDFAENVPVLMGLINIWYVNFYKAASHAILPYTQYLHRFAAYLQQLTMESNGKRVRFDGELVTTETGEVFWGEPGTNGQHAFYQLLHQGTQLIPADFIAIVNPTHPAEVDGQDVHELFLANFFAQTKALAFGKTEAEVRAEGTPEAVVSARIFPGNKPTTSIMAPELSPKVLGELIALYEHITFTQGVIWGIDSFDQWGVELGKQLALQIAPAISRDDAALRMQDGSTQSLIEYYRNHRK